nr:secoisolariciresinol dehydrogenase-like [Ipomoea batatas]
MFSNAGVVEKGGEVSILDSNYDNLRNVFDANVLGAFLCAKHAARVMIPARKGSVVFTSSVASVTHGDVPHEYTASKHTVVGLTKNLGVEVGRYGVRVNCVSPFGVATRMLRGYVGIDEKEKVEEYMCEIANLKEAQLGAKDVAEAALYLASDESKVQTSHSLIDGSTLSPPLVFSDGPTSIVALRGLGILRLFISSSASLSLFSLCFSDSLSPLAYLLYSLKSHLSLSAFLTLSPSPVSGSASRPGVSDSHLWVSNFHRPSPDLRLSPRCLRLSVLRSLKPRLRLSYSNHSR